MPLPLSNVEIRTAGSEAGKAADKNINEGMSLSDIVSYQILIS